MNYCAQGQPFGEIWLRGALNPCFIDTLTAVVVALLMGICATIELRVYVRHGTALDKELLGSFSVSRRCREVDKVGVDLGRPPFLYAVQLALSGLLFAVQPARLIVRSLDGTLYGHMLVKDVVLSVVWLMSTLLVYIERNYDLPTQPLRGHSIYLIIFWGISLLVDTVYFVNLGGEYWYFQLKTYVPLFFRPFSIS